jgi:hypothetical protein
MLALAMACAISCMVARADEIRLKDGSKIIGTIVGFEDDSFKVQTAYGFAMVRKTSIQEIVPSDGGKPSDAAAAGDSKPADSAALKPPVKPTPAPQIALQPPNHSTEASTPSASTSDSSYLPGAAGPARPPVAPLSAPTKPNAKPVSAASTPRAPAIPEAAAPRTLAPTSLIADTPKPPAKPTPLRESVLGNLYTNQTYGFSLYRPPEWELIGDARSAMPEAITALGTEDHSAMLVIGLSEQGGNIDVRAADTERKLRDVYENFRPGLSRHLSVAGVPAAELRFHGSGDGHDWSVIAVTLVRGNETFTILGMTSAESDLIQFQEAVISKVIGSLQFATTP